MVGTVIAGPAASRVSRSSSCGSPSARPEPPAVVVDHDLDVVGVVERRRAAVERGLVEVPPRRRGSPDQLRELAPVGARSRPARARSRSSTGTTTAARPRAAAAAGPAAWLPIRYPLTETRPLQRSGQSAARMSAVRAPQSNPATTARSTSSASSSATASNASAACSPLRGCVVGQEPRRPIAAQMRDDHPTAVGRQDRR